MIASIRNMLAGMVAYLPMQGPYSQTPGAFEYLYEWIGEHGLKPKGAPTAIYFNIPSDSSETDAVWELQVQLAGDAEAIEPDESLIGVKHVPETQVVTALHKGPFDSVPPTYQALWAWIEDNAGTRSPVRRPSGISTGPTMCLLRMST